MNADSPTPVRITLEGCDDCTSFVRTASASELALLQQLAADSARTSQCQCQPVLHVEHVEVPDER